VFVVTFSTAAKQRTGGGEVGFDPLISMVCLKLNRGFTSTAFSCAALRSKPLL
jgi:hypothetical protein